MRLTFAAFLPAALIISACGSGSQPSDNEYSGDTAAITEADLDAVEQDALEAAEDAEMAAASITPQPSGPVLTGPQRNAVRSARQYLGMTGFSRNGLIEQLSSEYGEGYDRADATVAVDSLDENWHAHAARSAQQYLNMTGFSCKGLIEQLSSDAGDKYTVEQATYGAQQAGAC